MFGDVVEKDDVTGEGCLGNEYGFLFGDGAIHTLWGGLGGTNTMEKEAQDLVAGFIRRVVLKMIVPVVGNDAGYSVVCVLTVVINLVIG